MNRDTIPFESEDRVKDLELQLQQALKATPPAGLSERLFEATASSHQANHGRLDALSRDVSHLLKARAPQGLAQRIYRATVHRLPGRAVIARIGFPTPMMRLAAAAAVVIATMLGVWMNNLAPVVAPEPSATAAMAPLPTHLAIPVVASESIDEEIDALALEVMRFEDETLAMLVAESFSDSIADDADLLEETLMILESQVDSF